MSEIKRLYINPGHSDRDPGAVGYETERKLNVKISQYESEYLLANYKDVETKIGSNDSLAAVVAEANAWGADLFESHHFNAGKGDGYEALVYSQKNVAMGKIYEKHVKAAGQNSRGVKLRPDLYVLKYTNMPAILNEGAFVDNLKDIQDWNEDHELKKLGIAYAKAAAEVLKLEEKEKKPEATSSDKLYRIRKSWADAKNQKGAYKSLDNAKAACPEGYTVYDWNGKAVYHKIAPDGLWDSETTERLQQIFGTTVDGVVSNQMEKYQYSNPGLLSGWDWKEKPNGKGSALIKAMQKWAGMPASKQDGLWGPATCKAVQKKLGTYVDGKVSKPSAMVKALQKWANDQ